MRYNVSLHARQSLTERGISLAEVDEALQAPQQIVDNAVGGHCYQSIFPGAGGTMYLLRVMVDDTIDPAIVITAYRTSRVDKYWRQS